MSGAQTTNAPPVAEETTAPVTVLPDYFPTFVDQCQAQAQEFFICFENEARMKDENDTTRTKKATELCQVTGLHDF